MTTKPEIYEFEDYRDFFRELFAWQKTQSKSVSLSVYAKKLGTSKSYLQMMMARKTHLTLDRIPPSSRTFKLTELETQYLTFSFLKSMSKDPTLRHSFDMGMNGMKWQMVSRRGIETREILGKERDSIVAHSGLALAICNLTSFPDFDPSPTWIRRRLINGQKIEDSAIEDCLTSLLRAGILEKKIDGRMKYNMGIVFPQIYDLDWSRYFMGGLAEAADALQNPHRFSPARFDWRSYAIDRSQFPKIAELAAKFLEDILKFESEAKAPNVVIHLSSSIYAVARDPSQGAMP